jgi:hypothetical protein
MLLMWEGIAVVDEAIGLTLLRRVVPPHLLSRTLGLEDSVVTLSIGVGSIAAPGLVALLGGVQGALIAVGVAVPLIILMILPGLRRIDARHPHAPPDPA